MAFKPFEKSKADKEPRSMKEGSKREEKFDAKQVKPAFKCGGPVKKMATGGVVRKSGRGC